MEDEYPLSKIDVDISTIDVDVSLNSIFEGEFNIKNITNGNLSGKITSDVYGLEFNPSYFNGNICNIKYKYESSYCKENIQGKVIIESNGGQIVIPININIKPNELVIDNYKINSLDSFAQYSSKNFLSAKNIFLSDDFLEICNISSLYLIRLYKKLKSTEYKENAMDNFLIATEKKFSTSLEIIKSKVELSIKCFEDKRIKYKIPLKVICKTKGWGCLECSVLSKYNSKWLEIITPTIKSNDITNIDDLEISFIIDPILINTRIISDFIIINNGNFDVFFELNIKRERLWLVETSKPYYNTNENGSIKIYNNTTEDIVIEIDIYDKIVKFNSKKYFISAYAEIPFSINISRTLELKKAPIYNATIAIKTIIKGKPYKKYVDIKVMDSRLKQIYD